jgi:hypothetical protein
MNIPQFTFLLRPLRGFPRTSFIAIPIVTFSAPWVIDLVLLLRLYAVFPAAITPRRTIRAVFVFAACVKVARLGCGIVNAALWIPTVPQNPLAAYSPGNSNFAHSLLQKGAAACDLVDHMCVQTHLRGGVCTKLTTLVVSDLSLLAFCGSYETASVHFNGPDAHKVR